MRPITYLPAIDFVAASPFIFINTSKEFLCNRTLFQSPPGVIDTERLPVILQQSGWHVFTGITEHDSSRLHGTIFGVRQGSILVTPLFTLYVNDIHDLIIQNA